MRLLAPVLTLPILVLMMAWPAAAQTERRAGDFDYYVLSLSWNAAWCESEGVRHGADQCDSSLDIGFTLHGLWPQYRDGWPDFCKTAKRDPSRAQTKAMADIMGDSGLAWHQWKKHGRCSGLDAADYFALAREAWEKIERPDVLRRIRTPMRIAPGVIEQAFIEANSHLNPRLQPDGVTVTCKDRRFREVRICLTKSLVPRACGRKAARDCAMSNPLFSPMR